MLICDRKYLDVLEADREAAHAACVALGEKINPVNLMAPTGHFAPVGGPREHLQRLLETRRRTYEINPGQAPRAPEHYAALNKGIDEARAKLQRLLDEMDRLEKRQKLATAIHSACAAYVEENRIELKDDLGERAEYDLPPLPFERIPRQIEKERSLIASLKNLAADVRARPVPREDAVARVDAEFARYTTFTLNIADAIRPDGSAYGVFGGRNEIIGMGVEAFTAHEFILPNLLVMCLAPGLRLIAERAIDDFYQANDSPVIASEQRKEELLRIKNEMAETERREEALIRMAAEVGVRLDRRADASPDALLGPILEEADQLIMPPPTEDYHADDVRRTSVPMPRREGPSAHEWQKELLP